MNQRRAQVVRLLEPTTGPLVHNPTRGLFLLPNAERYGSFLGQWGAIYERFGVPAEIGLAQAIIESGLNPRARSRGRAVGLCQWLPRNWGHLNRLAPNVIEAYKQTTQAPYCAAYLTILATMYGSFGPALSEHHAGGVNVGRTVINGERLGGADAREQYLLGAQFARDLRGISLRRYRELFRTFGLRSFLYAEMVFGNTSNVTKLTAETPQSQIFAMRTEHAIPLAEVTRRTGLSVDEVTRFNPAHGPLFEPTLRDFQKRFERTSIEEGTVMATTLAYVVDDLRTSRRAAILEEFRTSGRILQLFQQGVRQLSAAHTSVAASSGVSPVSGTNARENGIRRATWPAMAYDFRQRLCSCSLGTNPALPGGSDPWGWARRGLGASQPEPQTRADTDQLMRTQS